MVTLSTLVSVAISLFLCLFPSVDTLSALRYINFEFHRKVPFLFQYLSIFLIFLSALFQVISGLLISLQRAP